MFVQPGILTRKCIKYMQVQSKLSQESFCQLSKIPTSKITSQHILYTWYFPSQMLISLRTKIFAQSHGFTQSLKYEGYFATFCTRFQIPLMGLGYSELHILQLRHFQEKSLPNLLQTLICKSQATVVRGHPERTSQVRGEGGVSPMGTK